MRRFLGVRSVNGFSPMMHQLFRKFLSRLAGSCAIRLARQARLPFIKALPAWPTRHEFVSPGKNGRYRWTARSFGLLERHVINFIREV